jgi:predicted ester cyclase
MTPEQQPRTAGVAVDKAVCREERVMSEEDNKALVLRYFDERWNKKNFAIVDELAPGDDHEGHKAWMAAAFAAVGNMRLTVDRVVAEDNQVVLLWTVTGLHQGEYEGVPPTGRVVTWRGLAMLTVEDGRIVDDIAFSEGFGTILLGQALQQPSPAEL